MNVPFKTVPATGAKIPAIGFGTFGSDHISNDQMAQAVVLALKAGYRHIDCAQVYGNERQIGAVLGDAMAGRIEGLGPIAREDLWITGKLWNDKHAKVDVGPAFRESLQDLGLDYLDLYLVHWPFPNYHPPKCDVDARSPNARPYIHEEFMETWRELEKLVDAGLVRHIGTSNITRAKLDLLLRDCRIRPAVQEMELHPHFQQQEFVRYVQDQDIVVIGYCPLGSPNRPERDRVPTDTVDMEDPVVMEIAQAHGCHPAAVCLKWAAANGHIPIPLSTKERNIVSNLAAVCEDPLTDDEYLRLRKIDRNCRLIKGQVFLWEEAGGWEDLWDLDGTIPCPPRYVRK
ncbi:MAG: aldo/keto reductase [Sphaerochaetaceae bacterium]|jgi:diketogulonate reductase-like aldo/keto reductase